MKSAGICASHNCQLIISLVWLLLHKSLSCYRRTAHKACYRSFCWSRGHLQQPIRVRGQNELGQSKAWALFMQPAVDRAMRVSLRSG